MSKYEYLKEEVNALLTINPGLDSVEIAKMLVAKDSKLTVEGVGRWIRKLFKVKEKPKAKILIFDIETSPLIVYTWGKWNQNINDSQIIHNWHMLTWSAKWLFEDKVYSMKMTKKEILNHDDKRIAKGLWDMLNEADIVIAHNLKKFDKKRANAAFLKHGLNLPSHYREIDTLITARQQFALPSNRLDFIADYLGIEGKMDTGTGLWRKAIEADMEAIDLMDEYCKQDTRVLEDVYLALRPYIVNHPNVGLFIDSDVSVCKACGCTELEEDGVYTTSVNVYQGLRCKQCGSVHRSKKPITSKETKERIIR